MATQAAVPLVLAVCGYGFTTWHTMVEQQRDAQIKRVNDQLKELYGPLLMCVEASKSAFDAMVRQHSDESVQGDSLAALSFRENVKLDPESKQAQAYRKWVTEVFMPLNTKAASILVDRADLLDSTEIVPVLMQLLAHVSAYKVILKLWEEGDISASSAVGFPDDLQGYLRHEYRRLKHLQAELLGMPARRGALTSLSPRPAAPAAPKPHSKL